MPLPNQLAQGTNAVFCYTADLEAASRHLCTLAGQGAVYVRVVLTRAGGVERIDGPVDELRSTAWLVGHGAADSTQISTRGGGVHIETAAILDWCVGNGYWHVVDTCCSPDRRRGVAAGYRNLDYYSTDDGREVEQIVRYQDLGAWWDANRMALRSRAVAAA